MSSISAASKNALATTLHVLNQPLVKESIKKVAVCVTFAFGIIEVNDIYQISHGREITTENFSDSPQWIQIANRTVIICAKISLILSASVSRPGVVIISSLIGRVISFQQLERIFGSNTIFAVNPWHPRHVVSITAVLLALPSIAQSIYRGTCWAYKKFQGCYLPDNQETTTWFTDTKIRLMNLFNTATSRPLLHMGNQFGRFVLRSM